MNVWGDHMPTRVKERLAEIEREIDQLQDGIRVHRGTASRTQHRDYPVTDEVQRLEARRHVLRAKRDALSQIERS